MNETVRPSEDSKEPMALTKRLRHPAVIVAAPPIVVGSAAVFHSVIATTSVDVAETVAHAVTQTVTSITPVELMGAGATLMAATLPAGIAARSPKMTRATGATVAAAVVAGELTSVGTALMLHTAALAGPLVVASCIGVGVGGSVGLAASIPAPRASTLSSDRRETRLYRRAAVPGIWLAGASAILALGDANGFSTLPAHYADAALVTGAAATAAPFVARQAIRRHRARHTMAE